jgi:hypothetical protein
MEIGDRVVCKVGKINYGVGVLTGLPGSDNRYNKVVLDSRPEKTDFFWDSEISPEFTPKQVQEVYGDAMRQFETGATRSSDNGKPDYEGFISPLVLREYGAFMHRHRLQADGKLRDSDNWQKGMTLSVYMKSAWRHFINFWLLHRGYRAYTETGAETNLKEEVAALLFNTMGYLHEVLKGELKDT